MLADSEITFCPCGKTILMESRKYKFAFPKTKEESELRSPTSGLNALTTALSHKMDMATQLSFTSSD